MFNLLLFCSWFCSWEESRCSGKCQGFSQLVLVLSRVRGRYILWKPFCGIDSLCVCVFIIFLEFILIFLFNVLVLTGNPFCSQMSICFFSCLYGPFTHVYVTSAELDSCENWGWNTLHHFWTIFKTLCMLHLLTLQMVTEQSRHHTLPDFQVIPNTTDSHVSEAKHVTCC